jgi:amino acid transporter
MKRPFGIIKKFFIGNTLPNSQMAHQRLNNVRALAVFSSDALSSVAYSTEEILIVLQAIAATYVVNIAIALVLLLTILTLSYRQTIHAYPNGGGSYIVAKDNLGVIPGLIAASALLIDYVLTVSVSTASGIANFASIYPALQPYRIELSLLSIAIITLINLRGLRESGTAFAIPTYLFLGSSFTLLVVGAIKYFTGNLHPVMAGMYYIPHGVPIAETVTAFLLLRAFAAGCTALTGVEAISNGVPAFRKPEDHNAAVTMIVMAICLGTMIIGNATLARALHVLPQENTTIMSITAAAVFGKGSFMHLFHQTVTMGILLIAANTSFADFPRLASILSKDHFLPRVMSVKGDRLVFQNGILMLSLVSMLLIVIFKGSTHALLPLYAVGVFISFTLSQAGMVVRWHKRKSLLKAMVNGIGAVVTAVVAAIIVYAKFIHGAYIVIFVIPLVVMALLKIYHHYEHVRLLLKVGNHEPISRTATKHLVILPIGSTTSIARQALEELITFASRNVIIKAVHINIHDEHDPRREERAKEFAEWVKDLNEERIAEGYAPVTLDIIDSPFRSVIEPLDNYITKLAAEYPEHHIRIYIPELIASNWFAGIALHGHMGKALFEHFRSKGYQVSSIPKKV